MGQKRLRSAPVVELLLERGGFQFIGFSDEGKGQMLLREGHFISEAGGEAKRGTKMGSFVDGRMRELPCDGFFFPEEIKVLSFAAGVGRLWGQDSMV